MKLLFTTTLSLLLFAHGFGQHTPTVRIGSIDYVWSRHSGDQRVVFAKESGYRDVIKRSFINAVSAKWKVDSAKSSMDVRRLSPMRTQPKFNPSVSKSDTANRYLFFQLFDEAVAVNGAYSMLGSIISIKFRMINGAGAVMEDKSSYFRIIKRSPPLGHIMIDAFPFHPSELGLAFDTIADNILNAAPVYGREIRVKPACYYREQYLDTGLVQRGFTYGDRRLTLSVEGDEGFSLGGYSVAVVETGKRKHAGANILSGALTVLSNIETQKKRSVLFTADHSVSAGAVKYHCLISYSEVKTADRYSVKNDDGSRSLQTSDYNANWREIAPNTTHYFIRDKDTISLFKIKIRSVMESFDRMWDGENVSTVSSLPVELRVLSSVEMEITGVLDGKPFMLTTSNRGRTKELFMEGENVFSFYQNNEPTGKIAHRKLNINQVQAATVLCMISDKYVQ